MSRYIEGQDRQQVTLLPECLDDFIAEDNTVRIVDVFINELDLVGLGFDGAKPAATGRHQSMSADSCRSGLIIERQPTPEPAIRRSHTIGREASPFRYVGT